jgi:hypothetical protein
MKMENRFRSVGIGESETVYIDLYLNRWVLVNKIWTFASGDILRETQLS